MEIIVVEEEREAGGALVGGVIRTSISPFASECLDEAFGLSIGLWAVRFSEEMFEAELLAGFGKEIGAIGRAAIGQDALDGNAMSLVEGDGLVEGCQDTGDFFIGKETGKGQARMVIDGDMEGLGAGAWIAVGTIAGSANAGLEKAAKLFNIKMKELAWRGAFVAHNRRLGRIECSQAIEAVTLKDAGKGSFGDGKNHKDLGVGTALATE